jgi:hypothetical protein
MAAKWSVCIDTWYDVVRRGECPIEPIRVGRRMLWPKARVDELMGTTPTVMEEWNALQALRSAGVEQ